MDYIIIDNVKYVPAITDDEIEISHHKRQVYAERMRKEALERGVEPFSVDEAIKYYYPDELTGDPLRIREILSSFETDYYTSGFMTLKEWGEEREQYNVYKDSTGKD